jgi:hypothetical protein
MRRLTPLLLAGLLAACTTAPGETAARGLDKYADDPRLGAETDRICFASTIDGFSENKRSTVVLHEGRDRFMVEVTGTCFDLDNAESIGIDGRGGCLTPGDAIIVVATGGASLGPRRCMIREIRKWDPKAEKPAAEAGQNPV